MTTVVRLCEVTKEYTGGGRALAGVELHVREGEMLGIVGPSGSGRSTLLHVVGTLDRPSAGTVEIAGHDVAWLTDRRLSALRARHIGFSLSSSTQGDSDRMWRRFGGPVPHKGP